MDVVLQSGLCTDVKSLLTTLAVTFHHPLHVWSRRNTLQHIAILLKIAIIDNKLHVHNQQPEQVLSKPHRLNLLKSTSLTTSRFQYAAPTPLAILPT